MTSISRRSGITLRSLPCFVFVLLSIIFFPVTLYAQSPGGITDPEFWIRSYRISPQKTLWGDPQRIQDSLLPPVDTLNINFHLAHRFKPGSVLTLHNTTLENKTIAGIFYPTYGDAAILTPQFFTASTNGVRILSMEAGQLTVLNPEPDRIAIPFTPFLTNYNTKSELITTLKPGFYSTSRLPLNASNPWYGKYETTFDFNFDGYIPELLIYYHIPKRQELPRLYSYFAIKYALTFDMNYVLSDGSVAWDHKKNSRFHHGIAAIGKDKTGAIDQAFATTTYEDLYKDRHSFSYSANGDNRSLTIGFADTVFKLLPDKQFLFWGHDGIAPDKLFEIEPVQFPELWVTSRKWMLENRNKIRLPTDIKLGNPIKSFLQGKVSFPRYYLIKHDGPLDTSDIIPFTIDTLLRGLSWEKDSSVFSLAVADKLRFLVKVANKNVHTKPGKCAKEYRERDTTIKAINYKVNSGHYTYKVKGEGVLANCVYRLVYIHKNNQLRFFMTGGVGNKIRWQLLNNNMIEIGSGSIDRKGPDNVQLIEHIIPVPPLSKGNYFLVITDQTRQTDRLPISIK